MDQDPRLQFPRADAAPPKVAAVQIHRPREVDHVDHWTYPLDANPACHQACFPVCLHYYALGAVSLRACLKQTYPS